ncbi:diaminopimelate decarboxylase [Thermithiobacillus tepidarius DSM 3134]|uniref:diaminopimelate decarboxylase n=1 Tax=Thermithiobacillus tepidarius TaxID=929 RepID=UPI0003F97BB7|nr:diaminopimelate decarboxylase [Thermithiobacillus tepidarius]
MMCFDYRDEVLHAEGVPLSAIAADVGTPVYVYSKAAIRGRYRHFAEALGPDALVCFAVKANSNLAVLRVLAEAGAGFDIVSGGELVRVLRAGGAADKVVFSGVGKSAADIRLALEAGIFCFNVESEPELRRINALAGELGRVAPVALRVNPDVDPKTHPYISTGLSENKFGIPIERAPAVYRQAAALPHVRIRGIACHIGSQLLDLSPIGDAARRLVALLRTLQAEGISIHHLDLGGGVGIRYRDEEAPSPEDYARAVREALDGLDIPLVFELGRAVVGNAGVLLTQVEYLKIGEGKHFCVVDAAMNDLMRPALYNAYHEILPVRRRGGDSAVYDVVGPVCETGDFFARGRELAGVAAGDLLAVMSAGAYGFVMSGNYNTRPRVPEVLVDGSAYTVVRRRETLDDLLSLENTG